MNLKIRVIYDYNLTKCINHYNQIKNLLPSHELYIYNFYNNEKFEKTDYNIYMDCISENIYNNAETKKTILLVNEEYITNIDVVRRENYIDKPMLKIVDVVDYFFCFSNYSHSLLIKKKVHEKKIVMINGLMDKMNKYIIYKPIDSIKYIFYDIDKYSFQDNLLLVEKSFFIGGI